MSKSAALDDEEGDRSVSPATDHVSHATIGQQQIRKFTDKIMLETIGQFLFQHYMPHTYDPFKQLSPSPISSAGDAQVHIKHTNNKPYPIQKSSSSSNKLIDHNDSRELASDVTEAVISPRAKHSLPWFSAPADTDYPPSPPTESPMNMFMSTSKNSQQKLEELLSQHNVIKKQLKAISEQYPKGTSESELVDGNPTYHRLFIDLQRTRIQMKSLKSQDLQKSPTDSRSKCGPSSLVRPVPEDGNQAKRRLQTMKNVMAEAVDRLARKRQESGRPVNIQEMDALELRAEKEVTQKELLSFEKQFGRVKLKDERQIALELYERYRVLKRLVKLTPNPPLSSCTIDSELTDVNSDYNENEGTNRISVSIVRKTNLTNSTKINSLPEPKEQCVSMPEMKDLHSEKGQLMKRKQELQNILYSYQPNDRAKLPENHEYKEVKKRLKLLDVLTSM